MRRFWMALTVASIALSLGGASAWAAHHEAKEGGHGKERHKMHFEKRDADGDGEISKAEWTAAAEEHFAKMDADGDGAVTQEEWKAAHEEMRKRWKERHGEGH